MKSPFLNRTYRRLFAAQVIALAGNGLSTIALALLAYDLAGGDAGIVLGIALTLKMVAYVGIAPIVGGLAHKIPRREFLIGLDVARALAVGCLPFVTEIWQIYLIIFLLNACSAGFTPTFQATIPDILPDESQYTRALSLSRLAYDLENLLSPMLAVVALVFLSYDSLFAINAVAFLASALLVLSVRLPTPAEPEREYGIWNNMTFGIRVYLKTPRLRGLLALSLALSAGGSMVIINTVVYVRGYLGGTETETAFAYGAAGAGSIIVALMLPRFMDRMPDRPFMLGGGVILTIGLALGGVEQGLSGLLVIWFIIGIGSSLVQTPSGRLLKRSAHSGDRPAIYAAQFALSHSCWLIIYPLTGWLSGTYGITTTSLVLACISLTSTIVAFILWPAYEPAELEHSHEAMEHEHLHTHEEHHQHDHLTDDEPEPHVHVHRHEPMKHTHPFVIESHHPIWPR